MRPLTLGPVLAGLFAALLPAPAPASAAPAQCAVLPAAHRSAADTWNTGCLRITLNMASAPAVGASSTLDITVESTADRQAAIAVELPGNLAWAAQPAGLTVATRASAAPEDRGRVVAARADRAVRAGQPLRFRGTVTALAAGTGQIRASATALPDVSSDDIFLTISDGSASFGMSSVDTGTAEVPSPGLSALAFKPAGPAQSPPAPPSATTCATGTWGYVDHNGTARASGNATAAVYDRDASGGDDLLATGLTDGAGAFRLCFDNADEEGGGQDIYVRISTDNAHWAVQRTSNTTVFSFDTQVYANVATGSTTSTGSRQPSDPALMRGVEAFDQVAAGWNWTPGSCWDARDTTCHKGLLKWAPDSTDGTYYSLQQDAVHLAADDPKAPNLVLHEWGHYMMDDVYEDDFPRAPKCSPHYIPRTSSTGCAWTEGFATWFAVAVLDDPYFRWPNGASLNVEDPTWGTANWDNGDRVEGRVLGSLLDLVDSTNEGTDQCSEPETGPVWTTFLGHVSNTFSQYWQHRGHDGFDVGAVPLACLYQNTIDY
ncbi:hypothetical protein [Longispora albida]|uniref:hypothetical protein n=1 Tax=Longispora albida TaxID=203523 RepID=UPI0003A7BC7E|nr:hypothetical protein [Longispora albida]